MATPRMGRNPPSDISAQAVELGGRTWCQVVMFDCGVHPAHSGMSCLPYFDHINPAEVGIPWNSGWASCWDFLGRPATTHFTHKGFTFLKHGSGIFASSTNWMGTFILNDIK